MKSLKILFVISTILLFVSSPTLAGDFDWIRNFNIKAEADLSGLRAELAARFKIGNVEINTVLSNVERPVDAYMVLRLGEISRQQTDYVIEKYKSGRDKGWGALAKSLGIKPGSKEFHALKRSQDIYNEKPKVKSKGKGKGKN
ncbi:MAG: hypothetical protein JRF71_16120 [Deltaproteobacteria bacterium]|nr:hypothetical protein [Deltaproteobacteria bacterium]